MSKERKAKRKTWLYLVGQIILWWYFHLVFRMKVVGAENMPQEGPVLLCSNHLAKRDPVLLGLCQKRQVFYMAKEELFRNKFLGGLFRMLGAFPVKRGTGGADALEDAYTLLEENGVVGVFIEGHRSKDGRLLKPKTGAALLAYKTKAPVVPVCITAGDGLQRGCSSAPSSALASPSPPRSCTSRTTPACSCAGASRTIMGRIAQLREESCKELGLPSQLEPAREAPAQEAPHES